MIRYITFALLFLFIGLSTPVIAQDNTNPLLRGIKESFGGQGSNVLKTLPKTASNHNTSNKLPSDNSRIDQHYVTIPKMGLHQPVYQAAKLGDQLLLGDNEILETEINGHSVLYGHNQKTIFASLYQLNTNDVFAVFRNGQQVVYEVKSKTLVSPEALNRISGDPQDIFLFTCSVQKPNKRILIRASIYEK